MGRRTNGHRFSIEILTGAWKKERVGGILCGRIGDHQRAQERYAAQGAGQSLVMWPKHEIDFPKDDALRTYLTAAGVQCHRLPVSSHREWETAWRKRYQRAFVPDARFREGGKAVDKYLQESETRWLLVPFFTKVPGTSVHVDVRQMNAFQCEGPLQELGDFIDVEFFVSPEDLSWTFVRTHEDFVLGGPYFARAEE